MDDFRLTGSDHVTLRNRPLTKIGYSFPSSTQEEHDAKVRFRISALSPEISLAEIGPRKKNRPKGGANHNSY